MKKCMDNKYLWGFVVSIEQDENDYDFTEKWPPIDTFFDSLWDYMQNSKISDML